MHDTSCSCKECGIVREVLAELHRATEKHGPYKSAHEGFAVIYEEVDELWDEVKANDPRRARAEAIQVASTAIRFLMDLS
jgi:hypothetical protein